MFFNKRRGKVSCLQICYGKRFFKEESPYEVDGDNDIKFVLEGDWFDGIEITIDAPSALEEPKHL